MGGFVYTNSPGADPQAGVMAAFKANETDGLKTDRLILHELADKFVLCANWYCDTPAETVPNRHFIHLGTNKGYNLSNPVFPVKRGQIPKHESYDIWNAKTLYQSLDEIAGNEDSPQWAMYGFRDFDVDGVHACSFDSDMYAYTGSYLDSNIKSLPADVRYTAGHRNIGDFEEDIANGKLPFYTFINPSLNYPKKANGNSMHPSSRIQFGENYVAHVYNILRESAIWNNTLFIVTFDENGGFFDHLLPPWAIPPDGIRSYRENSSDPIFDYTLLGPRVPALLISPWLQNSGSTESQVDTNQYQNTSIPRFVQDLFAAKNGKPAPSLTHRDQSARSFSDSPFWHQEPPIVQPIPELITLHDTKVYPWFYPLVNDPMVKGSGENLTDEATATTAPTNDAIDLVLQYVSHLPGHADSGSAVTREFATCGDLSAYLQERNAAAANYQPVKSE